MSKLETFTSSVKEAGRSLKLPDFIVAAIVRRAARKKISEAAQKPLSSDTEVAGNHVSRNLHKDKMFKYIIQRCSEIESHLDSDDHYWQAICSLMLRIKKLVDRNEFDLIKSELESALLSAKSELEELLKAQSAGIHEDEETIAQQIRDKQAIVESIKLDLQIVDPTRRYFH